MKKLDFQVKDDSKDKMYFTIVPNYILNHSTGIDQALYLQMKRCAGENGRCFAGIRYFKQQLGVGTKRLNKSLKYLCDHKWITFEGKQKVGTKGGDQMVNIYKINDIWQINSKCYRGKKGRCAQMESPLNC